MHAENQQPDVWVFHAAATSFVFWSCFWANESHVPESKRCQSRAVSAHNAWKDAVSIWVDILERDSVGCLHVQIVTLCCRISLRDSQAPQRRRKIPRLKYRAQVWQIEMLCVSRLFLYGFEWVRREIFFSRLALFSS